MEEHTYMDALALSCRRLKAKGWTLEEIADRHDLTIGEVLSVLSRRIVKSNPVSAADAILKALETKTE